MNNLINKMSENEFITYIICTIADYAKANGYDENETMETMGGNLISISKVADFSEWKG